MLLKQAQILEAYFERPEDRLFFDSFCANLRTREDYFRRLNEEEALKKGHTTNIQGNNPLPEVNDADPTDVEEN